MRQFFGHLHLLPRAPCLCKIGPFSLQLSARQRHSETIGDGFSSASASVKSLPCTIWTKSLDANI